MPGAVRRSPVEVPQPQFFTGRIVDLAQVNPHLVSKLFAKASEELGTPRLIFTNTRFQDVRASSRQSSHQSRFQIRTAVCIALHNHSTEPTALPSTTEWPSLWPGEDKTDTSEATQPKPAQVFQTRIEFIPNPGPHQPQIAIRANTYAVSGQHRTDRDTPGASFNSGAGSMAAAGAEPGSESEA
jgi:hypothetical protein